ncbi:MAG TPA: metallophosphoesterase family protein [Anaerolineae bacterium]|nr:metallophosphoesterase family protein [Anaerolineae bacterium]
MIALVISDVHANLEALDRVLEDAATRGYDEVWFLGDAVGYGPDPNAAVDRMRALSPRIWLAGNHDWAALGRLDLAPFNPEARRATEWTSAQLRPDVRAFLETAEPRVEALDEGLTWVHGSPRHPVWEYILDAGIAAASFEAFATELCFFGHTHVPMVYAEGLDGVERSRPSADQPMVLEAGTRWLINPGSVGQPRDGDPRAAYALVDLAARTTTIHRVAYDIAAVQDKILAADLPPRLAARLSFGW